MKKLFILSLFCSTVSLTAQRTAYHPDCQESESVEQRDLCTSEKILAFVHEYLIAEDVFLMIPY